MAESIKMADGISPEIGPQAAQASIEPKVVTAESVSGQSRSRKLLGKLFGRRGESKVQVLVKPGEQADKSDHTEQTHPAYSIDKELRQLSVKERMGIVHGMPEDQQAEALRRLNLEMRGGSVDDIPDWLKEAAKQSDFKTLEEEIKFYLRVDPSKLTPEQARDLGVRTRRGIDQINIFIEEADQNDILRYVNEDLRSIYRQLTTNEELRRKPVEEQVKFIREFLGNYKESFWEDDLDLVPGEDIRVIRGRFEGIGTYIASQVGSAIERDLRRRPHIEGDEDIGDIILRGIKTEAARERIRQRRNATPKEMLPYNDWREKFDFTWAETPEELERTVFAWLEKFETHLPDATSEEVHQEGNSWKQNAINALEKAAINLEISEKDPFYIRLKSSIEAYVSVLAGVKIQESDGGFEGYTSYLEAFSHNFNGHHDAIYLGNAKSAIMQAYLARNHGEIALGASRDIEKPQKGDLDDFRESIEERALIYAATHELYIRKEDFDKRVSENNSGYGWKDQIEELLLVDQRDQDAVADLTDPVAQAEAIARIATRTAIFKEMKKTLEEEDMYQDTPGHFVSLASLSPDQRQDVIRFRIMDKMRKAGNTRLADDINTTPDLVAKDEKLWNWLKNYNEKREKNGDSLFFPSAWDEVRLGINTQTKLVDRELSEGELDAMIEKVGPVKVEIRHGVTTGVVEVDTEGLTEEQILATIEEIDGLSEEEIRVVKEDVIYDLRQRQSESERAFNINRNYQKFLGIDARWGGLVTREVNEHGVTELRTIYEKAEELLKAKIDLEESEIEQKVIAHKAALIAAGTLSNEEIEKAIVDKRRLFRRDSTFGATLALRELGIAHDLPIWNYDFFNDPKLVQAFAPYVGYTHGDKPKIAQLLDRGRREMRAVFDHLAEKDMDGRILVVQDRPNLEIDPATGHPKPYHEENWDRPRVINDAGEMDLRNIFESRFMISTSGGVEVTDLISKIADLGVYDMLWEMGCKDFREFQGFIKRRNEHELRRQSFWNTKKWKDPISYAKRLRDAGAARVYLVGGKTKQGEVVGNLVEPLSGAYKFRDIFFSDDIWVFKERTKRVRALKRDSHDYVKIVQELLENDAEDILEDIDHHTLDKLIEVGAGIIKPLIDYLNARDYVMNRGGRTPKNWKLDNELIVEAYFNEMLKRRPTVDEHGRPILMGGETLGSDGLAYAPQGRSQVAIKIFRAILQTSSYHLLSRKERMDLGFDDIHKDGRVVRHNIIQQTKERMEAKRGEIARRPLPANIQRIIDERRTYLVSVNTHMATKSDRSGVPNLDLELERIKNDYIETQLHKEVVGEWPARFA